MTSINESAYPRLKTYPTTKELAAIYTPNAEELALVATIARRPAPKIAFLVLLKTFQRLGYFPMMANVPQAILLHITKSAGFENLPKEFDSYDETNTRTRHTDIILRFLSVSPYKNGGETVMLGALNHAAATKDDIADIINVSIEELVRQRFELPGFTVLLRAAKKARITINNKFYAHIFQTIGEREHKKIDALFWKEAHQTKTDWDKVKQEPKKPTVNNIRDFLDHLKWLRDQDVGSNVFLTIPDIKLRHFSAEARSLNASLMRDLSEYKKYAIAATLIHTQTARAFDDLVEIFIKRMQKIQRQAKDALDQYHLKHVDITHSLISILRDVVAAAYKPGSKEEERAQAVNGVVGDDSDKIIEQCDAFKAHANNNYLPFLLKFYKGVRATIFSLIEVMPFISTSSDDSIIVALDFVIKNRKAKSEWLEVPSSMDLSWISDKWWPLVVQKNQEPLVRVSHRYFEICLFTQVMFDLKSVDLAIIGSDKFADYRTQLLSWEEFEKEKSTYCEQVGLPINGKDFVENIKNKLSKTATEADQSFPDNHSVRIENGEPFILKLDKRKIPSDLVLLDKLLSERLSTINVVDILVDTDHWLKWTKHFKPISGFEAKITNPRERYIAATFCYGCNLGPTQTSRSLKGLDRKQVANINQRHTTDDTLENAIVQTINAYNSFELPKLWGSGKSASADGTKWDLYEQNLLSEYHIRYGGYGGIAYYHVSDTYIALFSHFIPCGVWEAIYIIDGLSRNRSNIQPDTLHGDTQAQSAPVFALAHLLGIKLMPRIRNWKDLKFFRSSKLDKYEHIDSLFSDEIDWNLIQNHYDDMLRVAVSIKAGHITAATILRKLGSSSRKNKLYFAFRELGRVVRTIFLLDYICDPELRRTIQAATNKSEAYNGFTKWVSFGGGVITENNRDDQRKVIKYNHLVSSLIIFHNVAAMTKILAQLKTEGQKFSREALAALAPYRTEHINRFGDYTLNLDRHPDPLASYQAHIDDF